MVRGIAVNGLMALMVASGCTAALPSTSAQGTGLGSAGQASTSQPKSQTVVSKADVFLPMAYNPKNTKYNMYISTYFDLATGKETTDEASNRTVIRFTSFADPTGSADPSATGFFFEQVSKIIGEIPPGGIRCSTDERCLSFGFIDSNATDPKSLSEAPAVGYNTEETNGYSRIKVKPGNVYFLRVQGLKDGKPVNNFARVWVKDVSTRGATIDYAYQAEAGRRAME